MGALSGAVLEDPLIQTTGPEPPGQCAFSQCGGDTGRPHATRVVGIEVKMDAAAGQPPLRVGHQGPIGGDETQQLMGRGDTPASGTHALGSARCSIIGHGRSLLAGGLPPARRPGPYHRQT